MRVARVLVVDDNAAVAEHLGSVLVGAGYQVRTSLSAEEALELFVQAGRAWDLVITDTYMPDGMSGLDLIAHIQALQSDQLILRISGIASWGREPSAAGVPYLPKPFDATELLGRVAELLGQHPSAHV